MGCRQLPDNCPYPDMPHCTNSQNEVCCTEEGETGDCVNMDDSCRWKCNNNSQLLDFCRTPGTDMYMEGFQVTGNAQNSCVILFFKIWTLDSRLKFGVGCVGVIILGIFVEFLLYVRRRLQGRGFCRWLRNPWRKAGIILLFTLNLVSGYLAMLVAMTYSVELFLCMVVGLVGGHAMFNSSAAVGESVDPCCATQRSPSISSSKENLDIEPGRDGESCSSDSPRSYGSIK